ncbi:MAG: hypothetical protein LBG28_02620 [Tannerella sp.]|jgi:hypothetical protein|nr:hypothetical protein [Tannerella sp.]
MTFKVYINICASLILLSGIHTVISAQSADISAKKTGVATDHTASGNPVRVTSEEQSDSLSGMKRAEEGQGEKTVQRRSMSTIVQDDPCTNSFTNQTVSSTVSVLGCNILTVQNVTVTNSGNLSLAAPIEVVINGPFDVLQGGVLNVTGGGEPQPVTSDFTFYYDASGNRTSRVLGAEKHPAATADKKHPAGRNFHVKREMHIKSAEDE